ncbi:MAG TPA: hypothetical protein VE974_21770 [Thermoanaerobaculia bacterium]|nr:hypothetical protein [Thermoanaerobaculia bacterium]
MVSKSSKPIPASVTLDGTVALTPEQIVEQLRILRQHIPDFAPLAIPESKVLRPAAAVHDELVQNAADTIGASPHIANAVGMSADGLRNERTEVGRWKAVESELEAMHKGVASANLGRRYRIGLKSLQTYSIARQLVREPEHADLRPHVDAMRRTVLRNKRRKPAEPAAAPSTPPSQ